MANKKALVIGINNYPPPNTLPSCINDAQAFKALLGTFYGFTDIKTLFDADATIAKFESALRTMFAGAAAGDELVVYFSGHGYEYAPANVMKQYIVLIDGFYAGSDLAALTVGLPPGVLTVVLDSCFSGGMNKPYFVVSQGDDGVQRALAKLWTPVEEDQVDTSFVKTLVAYEPFGCTPIDLTQFPGDTNTNIFLVQNVLEQPDAQKQFSFFSRGELPPASFEKAPDTRPFAPVAKAVLTPVGSVLLNGLLVAACRDNETAAASNALTSGLSAFTYCLQQLISMGNANLSAADVVSAAQARLQALGFSQTPTIKSPALPADMENLPFVRLAGSIAAQAFAPAGAADGSRTLQDVIIEMFRRSNLGIDGNAKLGQQLDSSAASAKAFEPTDSRCKLDPTVIAKILQIARAALQ